MSRCFAHPGSRWDAQMGAAEGDHSIAVAHGFERKGLGGEMSFFPT